jgi:hypothetical protein
MTKLMNKLFVIIGFIGILVLSGCVIELGENVKNCELDSDCVVTTTQYCGSIIAVNQGYKDAWYDAKVKSTVVKMPCSSDRIPEQNYTAICRNNTCEAVLK